MKILVSCLCLFLVWGCHRQIPRAVEIDTAPIENAVTRIGEHSREVDRGLAKTDAALDRAVVLFGDLSIVSSVAMELAMRTANDELQVALQSVLRVSDELAEELALTKTELLATLAAKEKETEAVAYLSATKDALVSAAVVQAKQIGAMSEMIDDGLIAEDKLGWWRWRFAPLAILVIALLLVWTFRFWILRLCGVPVVPGWMG